MSRSIERAFAVMELLTEQREPVGVREIAARLGMPVAAAQRVLVTLTRLGAVHQDSETRRYLFGFRICQLSQRFLERMGLPRMAAALLREVRDSCDETVSLFVVRNTERVCVASEESTKEIRRVLNVGTSLPLWAGASGKLLLAYLPLETQTSLLERLTIHSLTHATVTDRVTLQKELRRIREQGYATSVGERIAEAASVAAPVYDTEGTVVAAFTLSAPLARWNEIRALTLIEVAREGAVRLSERLGYQSSRDATSEIALEEVARE